ncbi:amidohydrolase [Salibacter halophilus]|uniref:Amidohydrolase n=1 Tax=Salibacter halophilus TaxID=1803916 RepID=A0A6N6M753_9FLAO|nr:amidohydrolase [Salibacter halophilus]KAB1062129.1 amidohydrolase [Salibacter halophilus]
MRNIVFVSLALAVITSCSGLRKEKADLIVHNGTIYTVNETNEKAEAMAIRNDSIIAIGAEREIMNHFQSKNTVDLRRKFIYPGFADGHCHFYGYAKSLLKVNLTGTNSWEECISKTKDFAQNSETKWITGRGWDQNDWEEKNFPTNKELNELFPDKPVLLQRIDGHAAIANQAAFEAAGVSGSENVKGGEIKLDENGKPTGLLIDNAVSLISRSEPEPESSQLHSAILEAQQNCFAVGLTSLSDAGLPINDIEFMRKMQQDSALLMRLYTMISSTDPKLDSVLKNGLIQEKSFTLRSIKMYADGALGSRGAALLEPYSDDQDNYGLLLNDEEYFKEIAQKADEYDFQLNTHCIGDSANRLILDIYGNVLKGTNDKRWKIEHAQIVNEADVSKFQEYTIIPSVQPTHATSDGPWAPERLGDRVNDAYIYSTLLDQNRIINLGTDFPVEGIDPLKTFYSAVFRTELGSDREPFQPKESLTREEALRGMTIWPALSNFEESYKGSLEKGKLADFVVLNKNIMTAPQKAFEDVEVVYTYLGGKKVYENTK